MSEVGGIPYGIGYGQSRVRNQGPESARIIKSDGRVDDAFVPKEGFPLTDITDSRIKAFVQNNACPGPDWHTREPGGYDSDAGQSLFLIDKYWGKQVALRSTLKEGDYTVIHQIDAPFDRLTGSPHLHRSTEGVKIGRGAGEFWV